MKSPANLLCAVALLNAALLPARAGSPEYLNYQGLLNGADGQPLPTGNYTLEFNVHDQANGGSQVWGPFHFDGAGGNGHGPLVPVANGRFNVIIGPLDTLSRPISTAFAGTNRFIEIKVNGGPPILPRQQFLSTPYAFKANTADQATQATVAASVSDVNVALLNRSPQTFSGQNNFTGNIGLGTTATPTARLDVRGDIRLGPTGQYFAPSAGENLRIVRGKINANGTIKAGSGFSCNQPSTGVYAITFNQAFPEEPTITFTPEWYRVYASTDNASSNGFQANFLNQNVGFENTAFDFIAIGPR